MSLPITLGKVGSQNIDTRRWNAYCQSKLGKLCPIDVGLHPEHTKLTPAEWHRLGFRHATAVLSGHTSVVISYNLLS